MGVQGDQMDSGSGSGSFSYNEDEEEESSEGFESEEYEPSEFGEEELLSSESSESESETSSSQFSKETIMVTDPYSGAQRILTDYERVTKAQTGVTETLRSRFDQKSHRFKVPPKKSNQQVAIRRKSKEKADYKPSDLWKRAAGIEVPKGSRMLPLDWAPSDLWYHVRDQGKDRLNSAAQNHELHSKDNEDTSTLIADILICSSELAKSKKPSRRRPRDARDLSRQLAFHGNSGELTKSRPKRIYDQSTAYGSSYGSQNLHQNLNLRKPNMKPLHEGSSSKMELVQLEHWTQKSRAAEWCNHNLLLDNQRHRSRVQCLSPKVSDIVSSELKAYQHGQDKERLRAEKAAQENLQNTNTVIRRHLQQVKPKVDASWS